MITYVNVLWMDRLSAGKCVNDSWAYYASQRKELEEEEDEE